MPLEADGNNDTSEDSLRCSLGSSIEADVGNQTSAKRLQGALAMSMTDGNDKDELILSRICQSNWMRVMRQMQSGLNVH